MNTDDFYRLDELPPEHPLRQQPFRAPDGYFDALPMRLQSRIARKSRPAFSISWSWQRSLATMAGAGLVAVLVWQTIPQRQEALPSEALTGVSDDVIAAYLDDQGLNPYELADAGQLNASMGSDTTAIQFLNVQPTDIRQKLDEQNLTETKNLDS